MQYRKFGKSDWRASALGFGCMRLPTAENDPNSPNITESEAVGMIRHTVDQGVNYIDTAYRYHAGMSEVMVGKALKDGYRDKVKLATKAPMMMIKSAADYDRILDEQLQKLDTDCIDLYLFHALNKKYWQVVLEQELLARAEAAVKAGKIRHIGFSFHDSYDVFEEIVNGYDKWEFCQIQYNLMDGENQAGTKGLKLAASKGLAVVVMEPLLGGKLSSPVGEAARLMKDWGCRSTLSDLCLRWLWNQPEVSVVLSGMSTLAQTKENLASADQAGPGCLSEKETELLNLIKDVYKKRTGIPCTGCSYCLPCPQGIQIPQTIGWYNEGVVYDYYEESRRMYNLFGSQAKKCIACKACEKKCPQAIPISDWMGKIHEKLKM